MIKFLKKIPLLLLCFNIYCQRSAFDSAILNQEKNIKLLEAKQLIKNGMKFLANNSFEHTCQEFINNPTWRKGDLYISIYDEKGVCYAHGDNNDLIWHNFSTLKDLLKAPLVDSMFKIGEQGGFIIYFWNNGYKMSFVKTVYKNKKKYILESGYFPQDSEYACTELAAIIKSHITKSGIKEIVSILNDKLNPLSIGETDPFIYDMNGVYLAGEDQLLISQKLLDKKDDRGISYVQEFIKIAKTKKGQGWITFLWKGEEKRCFIQKVVDPKTNIAYVVGVGYYPNITYKTVTNFVERAAQSVLENGPGQSFSDFNSKANNFQRGQLRIFAYDMKGICKADGKYPNNTGQNYYNLKNIENRYIVREMINLVKNKRSGWISYAHENAFANAYIQKVTTGTGETYIVGSEFYPSTKKTLTETIVTEAVQYLETHENWNAFRLFSLKHSWFHWGEQYIFIYDINGNCLVNGFKTQSIWRNFLRTTDQDDKLVVGNLISKALDGGGWESFKLLNSTKLAYVKTVTKTKDNGETETFIVGSSYFQ